MNPPAGVPPLVTVARMAAARCDPLRNWDMRGQPSNSRLPPPPPEYEAVRRLLRAGADPNARDAAGRASTEFAGDAGALGLFSLLVQYGAAPNGGPQATEPPWFGLLRRGASLVRWEEPSWRYRWVQKLPAPVVALIEAWKLMPRGPFVTNQPVLPFLRSLGIDLTATNRNGGTILHGLAESPGMSRAGGAGGLLFGMDGRAVSGVGKAWLPVFAEFRRAGVNPEARDRDGDTAWLAAWRHRALEYGVGLATCGVDVKATNAAGANALHLLCESQASDRKGSLMPGPMVPYLVRLGVDPRARDLRGRTPLHLAVATDRPAYLALDLLDAGADPDAPDPAGTTPRGLVEASQRADLLRAFGARPRRSP